MQSMRKAKSARDTYDSTYALYFKWLINIVDDVEKTEYLLVYKMLFDKEFYAVIDMDENRAKDGVELRTKFIDHLGGNRPPGEITPIGPCRCLEMMVALAIEIENQVGDSRKERTDKIWMKYMIENLGLSRYKDSVFYKLAEFDKISRIIDNFVDREYDKSGFGGLWPLNNPTKNQRKVEIWYQFLAWYREQGFTDEYLVK